jgi:hypothetical protein
MVVVMVVAVQGEGYRTLVVINAHEQSYRNQSVPCPSPYTSCNKRPNVTQRAMATAYRLPRLLLVQRSQVSHKCAVTGR